MTITAPLSVHDQRAELVAELLERDGFGGLELEDSEARVVERARLPPAGCGSWKSVEALTELCAGQAASEVAAERALRPGGGGSVRGGSGAERTLPGNAEGAQKNRGRG